MNVKGKHYNNGDRSSPHKRRLLLWAECQIGKTGAFLGFLKLLRQTSESDEYTDFPPNIIGPDAANLLDWYIPSKKVIDGIRQYVFPYDHQSLDNTTWKL